MTRLRIALAQIDTTVGDLAGNAELVLDWAARAAAAGAHLVVFPELTITGYPVEDLATRPLFVAAARRTLDALATRLAGAGLGELPVVVGYLDRQDDRSTDSAAVLYQGKAVLRSAKHHLPNYGVFDERRTFVPGNRLPVFRLHGVDIAVAICEDLWQDGGPVPAARAAGAGLLVVLNASPFERAKGAVRVGLCARRAMEAGAALAYCNLVGGQDELVFDGDSLVVDATGALVARAPQFAEDLLLADLDLPVAGSVVAQQETDMAVDRVVLSERPVLAAPAAPPALAEPLDSVGEVYAALVTGVRDYVRKNGFGSVVLGLSGGVDSALVATIAADAIGPDNVHAVLLPSQYSSESSVTDAAELVKRQGLHARTVPIQDMVDAFQNELDLTGLAAENLQARVRGTIWMALSNQAGHLVLTTGNKSEIATGYSTLYGDSAGGYAPLKDVPKTLVWELCRWRNAAGDSPLLYPFGIAPIPEAIIDKPPSAELRPDQLDSDSLPPYEELDAVLHDHVEADRDVDELLAAGHAPELIARVTRLVALAEHKRRQYPPGPKVTGKNFGRDRRVPITSKWQPADFG